MHCNNLVNVRNKHFSSQYIKKIQVLNCKKLWLMSVRLCGGKKKSMSLYNIFLSQGDFFFFKKIYHYKLIIHPEVKPGTLLQLLIKWK